MRSRRGSPVIWHALLLGIVLALAACTGAASSETAPPPAAQPAAPEAQASPTASPAAAQAAAPPATFSGQEAYRHVEHLAQRIGSRPTGTPAEQAAADYIAARLAGYGYRTEQQPFEFQDYEERSASVEVLAPAGEVIPSNALFFSPGGAVSAGVVEAGIGRPEDFPSGGLAGQLALVERGAISFRDKVANAARAGAAGIIVYNNADGPFRGSLGQLAGIPAVGIAREDGLRLLRLLSRGPAQVRLEVDAGQRTVRSRNVVARVGDRCRVLIGGHYDSVPEGPGANDNASGTAVTLELARVLAPQAREQELCFVAFGGEELGLWGSRRFVEALSPEDKSYLKAMINLDMVGVGDRWRVSGSESLRELLTQSAAGLGVSVQVLQSGQRTGGGSDHASFLQAGIAAAFIHRQEDPNYHTAEDKADFVDPQALETAGRLAVELIGQLKVPLLSPGDHH
ncbi:MAG: M20/M25/M40 family metallo-hydrolase [Chloroflexi bacterium]|nr:M20/M25/M40 family metallo-hydrolase [Chloroflexota bacterium]